MPFGATEYADMKTRMGALLGSTQLADEFEKMIRALMTKQTEYGQQLLLSTDVGPTNPDPIISPGGAGPQGPKGDKGDTGAAGSNGTNGSNGADGATGPQGPAGDPADLYRAVTADITKVNNNSAQSWFDNVVTVEAATYFVKGRLKQTCGTTTGRTVGMGLGGSSTVSAFNARATGWRGGTIDAAGGVDLTSPNNTTVIATSNTSGTEEIYFEGVVTFSAPGTFGAMFTYSAAPGGAPVTKVGSYLYLKKLTSNPKGTWT